MWPCSTKTPEVARRTATLSTRLSVEVAWPGDGFKGGHEMRESGGSARADRLWTLTLLMGALAISGWGSLAYNVHFSALAQQQLRDEAADTRASRDQRMAERNQATAELSAAREEMTTLRGRLTQTTAERDEVNAQLKSARSEFAALQSRVGEAQVRETGSLKTRTKGTRSAARVKER